MNWRDKLQKGSFRGVEFCWRHSDATVGRKTARHDYPQRDDAYIEDMGKRPQEFNLECFVIGKNYTDQRDNMIAALEQAGAGTLIHPTMGMMQVCVCGDVRITESTDEGGMCRFSIPFIVSPDNMFFPSSSLNTAQMVSFGADTSIEASMDDFVAGFSVAGLPQYASVDAQAVLIGFTGGMTSLAALFPANVETPALIAGITALENAAASLVQTPASLAESITGLFGDLRTAALAPLDLPENAELPTDGISSRYNTLINLPTSLFNAFARLFDFGRSTNAYSTLSSDSIPQTTSARIAQAANRDAINALIRQTAIAEAARTASTINFISYDAAVGVMTKLLDAIDAEVLLASDSVYATLVDLRAAVVKDINSRGADLARIIQYTPVRTEPALVIAQRLYGDATRAEEIIARNNIRHPLFVPGGVPLEVLSD
jgi:prophage DNA circulation protein